MPRLSSNAARSGSRSGCQPFSVKSCETSAGMKKRCVCGRSKVFPLCDGTHQTALAGSDGWHCGEAAAALVDRCYVAGPSLENLAERLAADGASVAYHRAPGPTSARELVVLTDGTDLDGLRAHVATVRASRKLVLGVGIAAGLLEAVFEGFVVRSVASDDLHLYRAVKGALASGDTAEPTRSLERAFLSHAVADEPSIAPALAYLRRQFRADLFMCADSIIGGEDWRRAIVKELEARPLFIALVSRAFRASTFCAFEVGYAVAKGKRVLAVSLDGEVPPAYMQHLHMIDLLRRRATRPWLDDASLLVDALLEALNGEERRA